MRTVKVYPCGCKTIIDDDFVINEFCEMHKAIYKGKLVKHPNLNGGAKQ